MVPVIAFLTTGFWMLMIFDCIRNDPQKGTWIWILIFLNFPGAIIYFWVRKAPYLNLRAPGGLARWTRRNEIWSAEAAAQNIGKSYQFVNLGNILLDVGQLDQAADAYQKALDQEPENVHSLWGLASIEIKKKAFESAGDRLKKILKREPDYKFGEASLAYGQVLFELKHWDEAQTHLIDDVKRWSHPESAVMLASIYIEQREAETAKALLETMMAKVKASPQFHYRKKQHLVHKAQRMLRSL